MSGNQLVGEASGLHELIGRRAEVVIGLPASSVSTFPVILPETDASLHESMVFAQIEKRGLSSVSKEDTLFDFRSIRKDESGELFAVSSVTGLDDELVINQAGGYSTSAALLSPPDGGALLWTENKRLVFGIFEHGEPLHVQALSGSSEIGGASGQEISLLLMSLSGDEALRDVLPTGIEVVAENVDVESRVEFEKSLSIPVTAYREQPSGRSEAEGRDRLLPSSISKFRRRRGFRQRATVVGGVLLIAYLVAAAWLWTKGKRTVREIDSLERQISIVEPDVTRIQQISQRWTRLEPAFEKKWFPLVQLNDFTSALPGSGVVVREFRTNGRAIRVRGQARDVQLANRLLEDLQAMDAFASYDWSMPNPKVEKNNTATFEIEGRPKNVGADS